MEQSPLQSLALGVMVKVKVREMEEERLEVDWRPGLLAHPIVARAKAKAKAKAEVRVEAEVREGVRVALAVAVAAPVQVRQILGSVRLALHC